LGPFLGQRRKVHIDAVQNLDQYHKRYLTKTGKRIQVFDWIRGNAGAGGGGLCPQTTTSLKHFIIRKLKIDNR
jgi:hypothetical protein